MRKIITQLILNSFRKLSSYEIREDDSFSLRNGDIVSAMVPGLGTTLKYFIKKGGKIFLEAANPAYEPIELNPDQVIFQGKLLAVWRKI